MNWRYILIVVILAAIVGGGILAYQYLWAAKEEVLKEPASGGKEPISGEEPNSEIEYYIGGWFTREASDEDIKDFQGMAKTFQAGAAIMESFPMQFQIYPLNRENCPEVREVLGTLKYIQSFGECRSRPTQPRPGADESVKKEL